eukprot:gnl/Carplike_NY0171/2527_a3395_512.p1 GENE.gnl/Carplike_NY0171/2527_a3395_512~~gnl/Carplike_NY0171/2527_a3395_512.p1  ORF type:complete len:289 (+),score=10.02 gnl/Carplike_NY0171/2527_a3395_512:23-889(+)
MDTPSIVSLIFSIIGTIGMLLFTYCFKFIQFTPLKVFLIVSYIYLLGPSYVWAFHNNLAEVTTSDHAWISWMICGSWLAATVSLSEISFYILKNSIFEILSPTKNFAVDLLYSPLITVPGDILWFSAILFSLIPICFALLGDWIGTQKIYYGFTIVKDACNASLFTAVISGILGLFSIMDVGSFIFKLKKGKPTHPDRVTSRFKVSVWFFLIFNFIYNIIICIASSFRYAAGDDADSPDLNVEHVSFIILSILPIVYMFVFTFLSVNASSYHTNSQSSPSTHLLSQES